MTNIFNRVADRLRIDPFAVKLTASIIGYFIVLIILRVLVVW